MKREDVIEALDRCMMEDTEDFCKCEGCPMMEDENACDYAFRETVTVPRALLKEVSLLLDPDKSEWEHVAYVETVPKYVQ